MLDRVAIRKFLDDQLRDLEMEVPMDMDRLTDVFHRYVEDDSYEWLRDNFKSFFNHGDPDWNWIKDKA
ncbi:MAG: hypothetical protein ACLFPU_02270 [Dehalococcoidia bacterium]